jgi:tetratricopeptide (TPR) repeat protein
MKTSRRWNRPYVLSAWCACLLFLLNGCGHIAGYFTRPLFEDLTNSFQQQRDVVLAEQGTPAFLLVLDGLIQHSPDNKNLLLAGAQAYSAYSAAFVGDRDPERNRILADKAKGYALKALSLQRKEFAEVRDRPYGEFETCLKSFKKRDVPFLFFTATSWAGWIQANSSSMDALADLPKVEGLIRRVLDLDETFYYGAAHTFMGALLTLRPPSLGGKPEEAREHFEKAIQIGQGRFLPTYVMYANQYAKLVYEEALFFGLLNSVLNSPVDSVRELTLVNTLAQRQARDLIAQAKEEEYFD